MLFQGDNPEESSALMAVAVVGEVLIDRLIQLTGEITDHPGGSPANVAVGVSRLGFFVTLHTLLANDVEGAELDHHLRESEVDLSPESWVAARTGIATTTLDEHGSASYSFELDWNLGSIAIEPRTTVVHFGSIGSYLEPGCQAVRQAIEQLPAGRIVTYDPNVRPTLVTDRDQVLDAITQNIALANVVKASDEDIDWIAPGAAVADVAQAWLQLGPRLVVVTRGSEPPIAFTTNQRVVGVVPEVEVVDTVGAGDSFMAALVAVLQMPGLAELDSVDELFDDPNALQLQAVLGFASRAAAITVQRAGADPPWVDELGYGRPRS